MERIFTDMKFDQMLDFHFIDPRLSAGST